MPYHCEVHKGMYVSVTGVEGCQDDGCRILRASNPTKLVVFAGGPTTAAQLKHQVKFEGDMNAYSDAVKQGVHPEQVTRRASFEALAAAEAS